jgi:hypothetical protein
MKKVSLLELVFIFTLNFFITYVRSDMFVRLPWYFLFIYVIACVTISHNSFVVVYTHCCLFTVCLHAHIFILLLLMIFSIIDIITVLRYDWFLINIPDSSRWLGHEGVFCLNWTKLKNLIKWQHFFFFFYIYFFYFLIFFNIFF